MKTLILKNCRYIVTQDKNRQILENKDILIEDNLIAGIGKFEGKNILDCSKKIVMPGLINLHTHTITNLLRGVSDDLPLDKWLKQKVWPAEEKIDDLYYGSLITCVENIKNGVTTFLDMTTNPDRIAKAVDETKVRCFLGDCYIDFFNKEKREKEIKQANEFVKKKFSSLITKVIAPHALNTCSKELLKELSKIAKENNLLYHIHVLETKLEKTFIEDKIGKSTFEHLNDLKLLNENVLAAHLCWLSESEAKIMAKNNVKAVHCPISNLKLASGAILPLPQMLELGINVGLGTDSNASNNNQDILEEVKQAGIIHKFNHNDASILPNQTLIDLATINSAKILKLNAGSIELNKLADLITFDLKNIKLAPISKENILSHISFSVNGSDVNDTIINGELLMKDRTLIQLNEEKLVNKLQDYFEEKGLF
jgi:5-methylthioadenosine/S-adenosylhomocysteine deaminase